MRAVSYPDYGVMPEVTDVAEPACPDDGVVINQNNAKFLTLAWVGILGDLVDFSSPAVVNGVVYVGSFDGKLYAFNANGCAPQTSCQPMWTGATGNDITSSPAVAPVFLTSAEMVTESLAETRARSTFA